MVILDVRENLLFENQVIHSQICIHENKDNFKLHRLVSFSKLNSKRFLPKKIKVSGKEVLKFLDSVPVDIYLLPKVVQIMVVFGGLKRVELVKITTARMEFKV